MNKLLLRKIHRWLGLIAGIQLLAWTVSGLYFTLIPIDEIHGDHILDTEAPALARLDSVKLISPSRLLEMHPGLAEVYLHSGEYLHRAIDFRIPGRGIDFLWWRKYCSQRDPVARQGHGWAG